MLNKRIHTGDLIPPIQSLEDYFREGGVSIIQAAFAHSYFVHPDEVRAKTPYYPDRARRSLEHYPGRGKGQSAVWDSGGQKRVVIMDDNSRAQMAWEKYTGSKLASGTGYGVHHIWGNPWNPDAFTAGWNLCYMPFWAEMLTEEQHPHPALQNAIRQASWELYFRDNPVCQTPDFVVNPGMDLENILRGQPLLILTRGTFVNSRPPVHAAERHAVLPIILDPSPPEVFKDALMRTKQARAVLPIILDPSPPKVFKDALMRTKQARIVVTYQDGSEEVRPWSADRISPSSNIIGNLRSRPEFRAGAWQRNGIVRVRVSVENHPPNSEIAAPCAR